jgi:Rrf2 family protein
MLSVTCKIAIKAVIYLASRYGSGEKAGIKEIAVGINASEHTVGKLLQTLVKKGVINSIKGPSGGFYVTGGQRRQPLMNILDAVDGKDILTQCALGLNKCSTAHPCPVHHDFKIARDQLKVIFTTKRVADLCNQVNNGLAYLVD